MRRYVPIILSVAGTACFYLAHKLLSLTLISDNGYFRLYAWGLLIWAVRQLITSVSLFGKFVCNIICWLCVFNVFDEYIAANPMKPYKPYIFSLIVIITCTYIYTRRKCRKERTN